MRFYKMNSVECFYRFSDYGTSIFCVVYTVIKINYKLKMSNMMILCVEIFIENIITDQIGLSFGITCQLQLRNLFNIVPIGHLV
jgi:hypothetical protein